MRVRRYIPDAIRRRYSAKFAVIGLVVLLVVSGVALFAQSQVTARLTEEKQTTVQTNAELEAQSFGQWLRGQKQQIRSLSNDWYLQSGDEPTVRTGLSSELSEMPPEVATLHYVERDSQRIVASTNNSLEGRSLRTNRSVEENLEAGTVFWNPEVEFGFDSEDDVVESWVYLEEGEPSVALASPVPNSDRFVVSVIRTNVRARQFSSAIDDTRTVVVGGFTGLVLFSENKSEVLTSYGGETNTTLEQRVLKPDVTNTGSLVTDEHLVGYASVPGTDWVVVKEAPKSAALALEQDVERWLLFLVTGAMLGLIVLTVVTARGPMRSIRRLSEQARALASGSLSTAIEQEGRIDEVGAVQSSFQDIKVYLETATEQSDALANQQFDDPVLEREVPGPLGESLQRTKAELEAYIEDLETARMEAEHSRLAAEQKTKQLEVMDRLLRHNIKNDMNVVRLHTQALRESVDTPREPTEEQSESATATDSHHPSTEAAAQYERHVEMVVETVDRLLDKTAKQRIITQVLSTKMEQTEVDIVEIVDDAVRSFEHSHPAVDITLDIPESTTVEGTLYLHEALQELLDNAVVHNDSEQPEIEITVSRTDETVLVRIADNGPGLPQTDQEVLLGDQDVDPLTHGSGIGLWLVYWTVTQSGNSIHYEANDPRGSVIILELQAVVS
jgi:methyl-accepting chemotaxis protein